MERRSKILKPEQAECKLQSECFKWHQNEFAVEAGRQFKPEVERMRLFMIHNNPRNQVDGMQLKAQGLVKGVADLCYLLPNNKVAFIEMKTLSGDQKPEQKKFQAACIELGTPYFICRSEEHFKEIICSLQP